MSASESERLDGDLDVKAYFVDHGETFKLTVAGENTQWLTSQTPVDVGAMR